MIRPPVSVQTMQQDALVMQRRLWRSVMMFLVLAGVAFGVVIIALVASPVYGLENLDVACACIVFTSLVAAGDLFLIYRQHRAACVASS